MVHCRKGAIYIRLMTINQPRIIWQEGLETIQRALQQSQIIVVSRYFGKVDNSIHYYALANPLLSAPSALKRSMIHCSLTIVYIIPFLDQNIMLYFIV